MKVEIYSTPTCGYCNQAKAYFKEHNVEFSDYNVAEDTDKAREMVEKSGAQATPFIVVTDDKGQETSILGFDVPKLNAALGVS